jgi:hypothetical protein
VLEQVDTFLNATLKVEMHEPKKRLACFCWHKHQDLLEITQVCRLNWNVGVVTFFGADVVKLAGLQQTEMFSRTACLLAAFSVDPKAKCLLVLDNGYDSLLAKRYRLHGTCGSIHKWLGVGQETVWLWICLLVKACLECSTLANECLAW